jgi:hypothetical protein
VQMEFGTEYSVHPLTPHLSDMFKTECMGDVRFISKKRWPIAITSVLVNNDLIHFVYA